MLRLLLSISENGGIGEGGDIGGQWCQTLPSALACLLRKGSEKNQSRLVVGSEKSLVPSPAAAERPVTPTNQRTLDPRRR